MYRGVTMKHFGNIIMISLFLMIAGCSSEDSGTAGSDQSPGSDSTYKLVIDLTGSLQNPAFSPDGNSIVFTRFRDGYNMGPSDLFTYNLQTKELLVLVSDGNSNVNLPGSVWNGSTGLITFSSERETHDEIYTIVSSGTTGNEVQVTSRNDKQSYEPSFSPDGQWIVFESHEIDTEDGGVITKYALDGSSGYIELTDSSIDARQPNWSPSANKILYQSINNSQWDLWIMDTNGSNKTKVTNFAGNKTDAVFSPDGQSIIFSMENDDTVLANLYKISITDQTLTRLTDNDTYDGAASISPDGSKIIYESSASDPDTSSGTSLWVLDF